MTNDIEVIDHQEIKKAKRNLPIHVIADIVCGYFDVNIDDILIKGRKREHIEIRQLFHYLCKYYTVKSLSKIGSYRVGNFDHASVIHSIKTFQERMNLYKRWESIYDDMLIRLRNIELLDQDLAELFIDNITPELFVKIRGSLSNIESVRYLKEHFKLN